MIHYFATDGNYGDGEDILLIDTDLFTDEDWDEIESQPDNDRLETAQEIYNTRIQEAGK